MAAPAIAPYGSFRSPITSDIVARAAGWAWGVPILLEGEDVYWVEPRPAEGGRYVVMRRSPEGRIECLTEAPFNVRTKVHEYGGGAVAVSDGTLYFSNFTDQRLYRQDPGAPPRPLTPPTGEGKLRYADATIDRKRGRLICVREDHTGAGPEPVNTLVSLPLSGEDIGTIMVCGADFYASPTLSPDGSRLAWLAWSHPNLPWDGTELWVAEVGRDGSIERVERVAGGAEESIFQPAWSPSNVLHFVSDRTGFWNLYRREGDAVQPLCPMEAEFGVAQWVFGLSTYGFFSSDHLVCAFARGGTVHLASLDARTGTLTPIETPYTEIHSLRAANGRAVFAAASPTQAMEIVAFDPGAGRIEPVYQGPSVPVDPAFFSIPEAITYPTEGGQVAHGFFYSPRNPSFAGPPGERPPLIVISHGGPTGATSTALNLNLQFWTSRGFAVLDVNYGGSTRYGRAYRLRLDGTWGIVDVDDCVNGARHLVHRGLVDPDRLIIRGASAGGYTTLAALTFRDVFKAGASYFGLSELHGGTDGALHKFESRYGDRLIAPWPSRADVYRERSPIHFTERLSCPIIFFQGLEDAVVHPAQAEKMVEALRARKLPVAYLPFEGEQHGFRRAENIQRTLEAELYFYSRVFGFELADPVEPVVIDNL
jgi:dipeptidyl aminopeptidase/acylaminoacyl peptidase